MINKPIQNLKFKIQNLLSNQGFMKYFKNTSWLFGERILRMIVALFVGVYVARYLGPKQYGLLSYAMAFVGLFSAFASLGLDGIVVRELVKMPEKRDELLGTAFWLKIAGAVIMGGAILIGVQFTDNDSFTNLLIAIIAAGFIFQAFNVINLDFQATVKSKYVVQVQVTQMVISSIAKLTLIWISAPLLWFAVVSLSDTVVLAIGLVWNYLRKIGTISLWKPRISTAKNLLKNSWPLILSGVAIMIYMRIDQVMIKAMMGSKEVGYYAAAVKLSEAWYFIPMTIASSLFPAIINAKKVSEELYYARLQRLYDLMVWMAVAIALPTTFLAPWVIKILYGNAYLPATGVLSIYIWASVFIFLGVASGNWFITENLQRYSLYRTLAGVVINIILNYIFIPIYSIYGAAFATLISQVIASYLFNITNKKLRYTFLLQTNAILLPLRKLGVKLG